MGVAPMPQYVVAGHPLLPPPPVGNRGWPATITSFNINNKFFIILFFIYFLK
jgi:hypothetical protein